MSDTFLKLEAVKAKTSLSRSEIFRRIKLGEFPGAFPLGYRLKAWSEAEVDEWMARVRETTSRVGGGP